MRGQYAKVQNGRVTAYPGHVNEEEADYYHDLGIPDGSFLSFANTENTVRSVNGSRALTTVEVEYTLVVSGRVEIALEGKVLFGYGSKEQGATERQWVDITLEGLSSGGPYVVAKMAPRRQSTNGLVRYPNGTAIGMAADRAITGENHVRLKHTDEQVESRGYELYAPEALVGPGRFVAEFAARNIVDEAEEARMLSLRYTLTLPARYDSNWVNDDVILYKPTVTVCS